MSGSSLAERAAMAANGSASAAAHPAAREEVNVPQDALPLEDPGIPEPSPDGPELVRVRVAWRRVRQTVGAIGKGDLYNASGTKYNFRGADRAINAFGPATLLHGVDITPVEIEETYRDTKSSKGTVMHECSVKVTWEIHGPMDDFFLAKTIGLATDYADKAASKAQTVALRTLLFNAGMIPTNEPDPDSSYMERGDASAPSAAAYLAEITNPYTSRERFRQIWNELGQHRLLAEVVEHDGASGELRALYAKVGNERWPRPTTVAEHSGAHDESGYSAACATCQAQQAEADREAAQDA